MLSKRTGFVAPPDPGSVPPCQTSRRDTCQQFFSRAGGNRGVRWKSPGQGHPDLSRKASASVICTSQVTQASLGQEGFSHEVFCDVEADVEVVGVLVLDEGEEEEVADGRVDEGAAEQGPAVRQAVRLGLIHARILCKSGQTPL